MRASCCASSRRAGDHSADVGYGAKADVCSCPLPIDLNCDKTPLHKIELSAISVTENISNVSELRLLVTRARLPRKLIIMEPRDNYHWEDKVCIINEIGVWEVFYFDRGEKLELQRFVVESSAVRYFIELAGRAGLL